MTCERCGYEHPSEVGRTLEDALLRCIANLRADLAEARADLAEADREDEARERFDTAIHESTNAMMREALGAEMYSRLWGPELERLGYACDRLRADLVESRTKELDAETRACAAEERAARVKAQCAVMREAAAQAAETQPFYSDTHTGMRQQWVKVQIAARIRALPPDAGRDLLTAVRRLREAARALLFSGTAEAAVKSTCDLAAALGDPALAGLRGAP